MVSMQCVYVVFEADDPGSKEGVVIGVFDDEEAMIKCLRTFSDESWVAHKDTHGHYTMLADGHPQEIRADLVPLNQFKEAS